MSVISDRLALMLTTEEFSQKCREIPSLTGMMTDRNIGEVTAVAIRAEQHKVLLQEWKAWLGYTYAPALNADQHELIFQNAWLAGEEYGSDEHIEGHYERYAHFVEALFVAHTGEEMVTGYPGIIDTSFIYPKHWA